MNPFSILYPLFALFALYVIVWFVLMFSRLFAILSKKVKMDDFKLMKKEFPENLAVPARNYINLFEAPVLFYIVIILIYGTEKTDSLFLNLAWAYVAFRYLHSLVHLTFNNVNTRFAMFFLSNLILIIMWVRLGLLILTKLKN